MAHAVGLGDPDDDDYDDAATTGCQYLNAGDRLGTSRQAKFRTFRSNLEFFLIW